MLNIGTRKYFRSVGLKWRTCSSKDVGFRNISGHINAYSDDLTEMAKNLTVSIVGRPNTGKSTLFNRLTQTRMAIVSNVPGTTRDRREGQGYIAGLPLNLVDTGGLDDRGAVSSSIQTQVSKAFEYSDVVLFMLDGRAGVTALDLHFAQWIRKTLNPNGAKSGDPKSIPKSIILVANKTEGAHMSAQVMDTVAEALRMGFGEPILISASHGDGLADLAQELFKAAKERGRIEETITKNEKRKMFKTSATESITTSATPQVDALDGLDGIEGTDTAATDATSNSNTTSKNLSNKIPVEDRVIQLAIMGRPNVGKSTLLNAFVRDERSITGPMAGLTRDAVHVEWAHRERQFKLVDTAGLTRIRTNKQLLEAVQERRQTAQVEKIGLAVSHPGGSRQGLSNSEPSVKLPGRDIANPELDPSQFSYQISEYALISALNALRFAQVVLLVVEGTQGKFSKLDLQLARKCLEEGRGLVIAANKADIMDSQGVSGKKYEEGVREHIEEFMREFGDVPVVVSSGTENKGIDRILNTVINVHDAWSRRVDTGSLNSWLRDLLVTQAPPRVDGKALNLKYITQVKSRPPTFALFTNQPEIPIFFERYLKSHIQTAFNLQGVPIRFVVRKTKGIDIHRSRKEGSRTTSGGNCGSPAARSARSPSGMGTWRSLAKGKSMKKGVVGPNRDKVRVRRRIAGVVRHKRKSEAGKGLVKFSGLRGVKDKPVTSAAGSGGSGGGGRSRSSGKTNDRRDKGKSSSSSKEESKPKRKGAGLKNKSGRASAGGKKTVRSVGGKRRTTERSSARKAGGAKAPVKSGGRVSSARPVRKTSGRGR